MLGGGLGFSLGQCVQAFHAWNPELFQDGWPGRWDPLLNWWNFMEITFGAIADHAITMGLIPLVAVAGGRAWPYLLALPMFGAVRAKKGEVLKC